MEATATTAVWLPDSELFTSSDSPIDKRDRERNRRALAILALGHVIPSGREHTYLVYSQSKQGTVYRVHLGHRTCECASWVHRRGVCKHIAAAAQFVRARRAVIEIAWNRDATFARVAEQFRRAAEAATNPTAIPAQRLAALAHVAQDLADRSTADRIVFTIRYRTSGGKHNPVVANGRILTVHLVDALGEFKEREPRDPDYRAAIRWLEARGYRMIDRAWLDPAGYIRTAREIWRLPGITG